MLDDRQMMHTMAVTQADYRVLTPDHASPEQIRGDLITTASDTYVLGVVLYELLCGCKPFALKGNRLGELERAICEETPPPPSVVDTGARGRRRGIAQTARHELRRGCDASCAGDLDNIVLMAMRKEAERRYSSVEQFAADIERYLDGMPVLARADAWSYRAGKFLKRHALGRGSGRGVRRAADRLLGHDVHAVADASRRSATSRRQSAPARRRRSSAPRPSPTFLIDSFRLADPSHARGKEITAREILDNGAARITQGAARAAGPAGDAARYDRQRVPQPRPAGATRNR